MNQVKKFSVLLLISIILILLGWLSWQTTVLQKQLREIYEVQETTISKKESEPISEKFIYENAVAGYKIELPSNYKKINSYSNFRHSQLNQSITFQNDSENFFKVKTIYAPQDADFYFDNPPVEIMQFSNNRATKYILPTGYCDGPACSPPVTIIKVYRNNIVYGIEFYHTTDIQEEHQEILDGFEFIGS